MTDFGFASLSIFRITEPKEGQCCAVVLVTLEVDQPRRLRGVPPPSEQAASGSRIPYSRNLNHASYATRYSVALNL